MTFQFPAASEGSTRDLAYRWIDAVLTSGPEGPLSKQLLHPDCRYHLPRSTAVMLGGADLDISPAELGAAWTQADRVIDLKRTSIARTVYDVFQEDHGGIQYFLKMVLQSGESFDLQTTLTFQRDEGQLVAIWIHADTAMLKMQLHRDWRVELK